MKYSINILFLISIMVFASCEAPIDPFDTVPDTILIKTESKYLVEIDQDVLVQYKEYNLDQQITLSKSFDEKGIESSSSKFVYEDNSISEIRTENDDISEVIVIDYELDVNGQISQIIEYNSDGTISKIIIFEYNAFGNLVLKKVCENGNYDDFETIEYVYSEDGKLKGIYKKDPDMGSLTLKDSLVYDNAAGIDHIKFDDNGEIKNITKIYYNIYGLPSNELIKNSAGEVIKEYKYEYTFYN